MTVETVPPALEDHKMLNHDRLESATSGTRHCFSPMLALLLPHPGHLMEKGTLIGCGPELLNHH
jgi:hypothetical protein